MAAKFELFEKQDWGECRGSPDTVLLITTETKFPTIQKYF